MNSIQSIFLRLELEAMPTLLGGGAARAGTPRAEIRPAPGGGVDCALTGTRPDEKIFPLKMPLKWSKMKNFEKKIVHNFGIFPRKVPNLGVLGTFGYPPWGVPGGWVPSDPHVDPGGGG